MLKLKIESFFEIFWTEIQDKVKQKIGPNFSRKIDPGSTRFAKFHVYAYELFTASLFLWWWKASFNIISLLIGFRMSEAGNQSLGSWPWTQDQTKP